MSEEEKLEIEDIKDPLEELESESGEEDSVLEVEEIPSELVEKEKPAIQKVKAVKKEPKNRSQKVKKEKETKTRVAQDEPDVLEQAVSDVKPEEIIVEKKRKSFLKTVSLVFLTMLVTCAVVLGGVYFWLYRTTEPEKVATKTTIEENPVKKEEVKERIVYASSELGLNLRKEPATTAEILAVIPNGTKLAVLEEKGDWYKTKYQEKEGWVSRGYVSEKNPLVYENKDYGFSLTFPENWVGYKVFPVKIQNFGVKSFYVALPTTDKDWKEDNLEPGYASFLALTVMTKEEWKKVSSEEGPRPTLLKESEEYVYVWTPAQAGPADISAKMKDVSSIVKTFELIK